MTYALCSPTVLAVDAACHPRGADVLAALGDVFRLTDRGLTHLGLHALDADRAATAEAWGLAELVDAAGPSTGAVLDSARSGRLPAARTLARTRLGDVRDVARFVVVEAASWPDAPRVRIPGDRTVPASAAAAAAAVCGPWTRPDLPDTSLDVLLTPWRATVAQGGALVAAADVVHGARADALADLRATVTGGVRLEALAQVTWPTGVWARTMHSAAWAAYTTGRLRSQLLAVVDLTAAVLETRPDADPVLLRTALPTVHALAVAAVLADVLDGETLGELRLGAAAY